MKKRRLPGLLLFLLLLAPGCSRKPSADLPPTMVWHKDQNLISPASGTMNAWEGFQVEKDAFAADRDFGQFILWRSRPGKVPVSIEYSFKGKKVDFAVNVRQRRTLRKSPGFRWEKFNINLSRGFNFLSFRKKGREKLRVRSIAVGKPSKKQDPHLQSGESFSFFHFPGRGRLELRGTGKIEVVTSQTDGKAPTVDRQVLASSWLSKNISHEIRFPRPGFITVKALKGSFNISAYSYTEAPIPRANPRIVFQDKPNIYIVLSDACQALHIGTYGYSRNTSPHIDAFARDAVVYENAYANCVFTRSSVATLFTGLYPDRHKTRHLRTTLSNRILTLPEYLNAKGYATSLITATRIISPPFGFGQGVNDFFSLKHNPLKKNTSILDQFEEWLKKTPAPNFSYMHYLHPHFPKVPPENFPVTFMPGGKNITQERMAQLLKKKRGRRLPLSAGTLYEITASYDSSIAWVDSEFGKFMALLRQKNLYDNSMIIFLADHGEAQNEHGVMGHGSNVYNETTQVPLIVKYPKNLNLAGRVRSVSEVADVFPTIASLFGQQLQLDGGNLLTSGFNRDMDDKMVVSRSVNPCPRYGMRWKNWYYTINLHNNQEKLYLLSIDPIREVGKIYPQMRAFFYNRFLAWFARFRNTTDYSMEIPLKSLPKEEIEEMKTLGYL